MKYDAENLNLTRGSEDRSLDELSARALLDSIYLQRYSEYLLKQTQDLRDRVDEILKGNTT